MKRRLIVNADDCNLTEGVTRGILECHENGIVSSTSWMVNLPCDTLLSSKVLRSGIGMGLHLNVTAGAPVSKADFIPSLLDEKNAFRRPASYCERLPVLKEVMFEYFDQIALFKKIFGRMPTHLDTHHQLHDQPLFMKALGETARQCRLPVRRSALMKTSQFEYRDLKTPQGLEGHLDANSHWTDAALEKTIVALEDGVTEIMCHPGFVTEELTKISSMITTRAKEQALFSSSHWKSILNKNNVELIHFGNL